LDEELKRIGAKLKIIGNPGRLSVLKVLTEAKEPINVTKIAERTGLQACLVSQHLSKLTNLGIVKNEVDKVRRIYMFKNDDQRKFILNTLEQ
jgi:DNA-binding transcriptional ArsR family regulator